jgi:hypothetical protein
VVAEYYCMVKIHACVRIRSLPVRILKIGNGFGNHAVRARGCDGKVVGSHLMVLSGCRYRERAILDENAL